MKNHASFIRLLTFTVSLIGLSTGLANCVPNSAVIEGSGGGETAVTLTPLPTIAGPTTPPLATATAVLATTTDPSPLPPIATPVEQQPVPTPTLVIEETAVSICTRPPDLAQIGVDATGPGFCIVWLDEFDNEKGFEIRLFYPRSDERFVYTVGPNMTEFVVPDADAPHLDKSVADCDRRQDFDITVIALSETNRMVGGMAAIIECRELFAPPTPEAAAHQLQNSLTWQEMAPNLHQLTGWESGYRSSHYCDDGPYRWLDDAHLMLFPIMAETVWAGQITLPVILNVTTGAVWVTNQAQTEDCQLPVYTPVLQLLVESKENTVWVRQLDGFIRQSYQGGNPLHLGESGQRRLAGNTWIDLTTGESVVLPIDEPARLRKLAWTEDDTRFYACCAMVGDVQTGSFYRQDTLDGIFPGGIGIGPEYSGETSQWFDDGRSVMHEEGSIYWTRIDGADVATHDRPPVTPTLPLIDPANQTYINLGEVLGLTETVDCHWYSHIRPFHDQVWLLNCTDEGLLVAFPTLSTKTVAGYTFVAWSPNGRYALLTANNHYTLLDPDTMTFTPLPDVPTATMSPIWSPQDAYVAVADDRGLYLVETAVGRSRFLPDLQPTDHMAWQPGSNTLAVALRDNTIRLIAVDAGTGETISPPFNDMRALRWSPDGTHLSFITEHDVIVWTP